LLGWSLAGILLVVRLGWAGARRLSTPEGFAGLVTAIHQNYF
jgi:hypothetical protein